MGTLTRADFRKHAAADIYKDAVQLRDEMMIVSPAICDQVNDNVGMAIFCGAEPNVIQHETWFGIGTLLIWETISTAHPAAGLHVDFPDFYVSVL